MSEEIVESPAKRPDFTEADVEVGLRLLVLSGGDESRAARLMASEGRPVDPRTLRSWRDERYAQRYSALTHEIANDISLETASRSMELAGMAQSVEEDMIREAQHKLKDIPARDLARSALAMAQIGETHTKTSRLLRDQPTSITEVRDVSEIMAELKHLEVIEGTAEEVED